MDGFDSLGGSNSLAIVQFEGGHIGDNILLTAFPLLAWIASQVQLFEIGQFAHADHTVIELENIDEVDSHV